jgi:hypothetical protein
VWSAYAIAVSAANDAGVVTALTGSASLQRGGESTTLQSGARVLEGDRVVTGADGYAGITLRDETHLTLGPNSNLLLDAYAFDSKTQNGTFAASFTKGTMRVITGMIGHHSPESFSVKTATATIGIRGTQFVVEAR